MDDSLIWTIAQAVWPVVVAAAILRELGQTAKKFMPAPETGWLAKVLWMTMPLHPIVVGALFGMSPFAPVSDLVASVGDHAGPLYYAGAGFLSVYYHDILNTWKKYRSSDAE